MKKIVFVMFIFAVLFSSISIGAEELIEESQEAIEFEQVLIWGKNALLSITGLLGVLVGLKAKKFISTLTDDKIVNIFERVIERFSEPKKAETLKAFVNIIVGLPVIKKFFEDTRELALSKLDQLENEILEWEAKIETGILSEDLAKRAHEHIAKLKDRKLKLLEKLHEENT